MDFKTHINLFLHPRERQGNLTFYNLLENEGIFLRPGERLVIGEEPIAKMVLLPTVANADAFAVLSDSKIGVDGRFELFLCSKVAGHASNATRVACRTTNPIAVPIPASTENDAYPFSGNTFSFASIEFQEMGAYNYFAVVDKSQGGFLIIEPFKTRINSQVIHQSMLCKLSIFFFTWHFYNY
jgi:glycosylphosphatidylinositol deacylase